MQGGLVVVIGSLNMDLTFRVERFPRPGETIRGLELRRAPGGKGANQAVAAARAGATVAMVGAVGGDDFGRELRGVLGREGIGTRHLRVARTAATGVAGIAVDRRGENHIIVVAGANGTVSAADVRAARPLLRRASVVLVQREIPDAAVAAGLAAANDAGARAILNPAPAARLTAQLLRRVDALVVNESEAATLLGAAVEGSVAARDAAVRLAARTRGGLAIVTRGARGAWLAEQGGLVAHRIAPYRVHPVDTTGAGDAFLGALAARLAAGSSPLEAAGFAAAAGALATTRHGAIPSLPSRGRIEALWRR